MEDGISFGIKLIVMDLRELLDCHTSLVGHTRFCNKKTGEQDHANEENFRLWESKSQGKFWI